MIDLTLENVEEVGKAHGALQHPQEALELIKYLREKQVKLVLEVGVWRAGLAAQIKTFIPEVEIIGVDINQLRDEGELNGDKCYPWLENNIKEFGIKYVIGNSHDQVTKDKVLSYLGSRKADFCFIDAGHDYDSVKKDFEMWSPLAKAIGFHDLHNEIGPWRLWEEIKDNYLNHELKAENGLGIGILEMI